MKTKHLIMAFIGLVFIGAGLYSLGLQSQQDHTIAIIEKDGKALYRFDLQSITDTQTYTIGEDGAQNDITVSPEGICVSRADCPDQTCVKQGVRRHGPTPIVCLPQHLSIRFVEDHHTPLDATTGH